jgi:hypothetical protein
MSNHAIEQTPLEVGTPLMTREQIDALPVGTVIGPGPYERFTRVENGWEHLGITGRVDRHFALGGWNKVLELPPPRFEVGQTIHTRAQISALPEGTTVEMVDSPGNWYRKVGGNQWRIRNTDRLWRVGNFSLDGANRIRSLPGQQAEPPLEGRVIDSMRFLLSLPVGTTLGVARQDFFGTGDQWVISGTVENKVLRSNNYGSDHPLTNTRVDGYLKVVSVPGSNRFEPDTVVVTGSVREPMPPQRWGALAFVRSHGRYSTYLDTEGNEVHLAHGTRERLVEFDEIVDEVYDLWSEWQRENPTLWTYLSSTHIEFLDYLRAKVTDPDSVEEVIRFCSGCNDPHLIDDMKDTNRHDDPVCEDCFADFTQCVQCSEWFGETTYDLSDRTVCEGCRVAYWLWCNECDGYYFHERRDEHRHNDCSDACDSPAKVFSIRNDGDEPLDNDTRATITLPEGVISAEGLSEISRYIQQWSYREYPGGTDSDDYMMRDNYYSLACRLPELGDRWQAKDGNYTKRLSRLAYKEFKLKVPPEVISRIGNIASDHSREINFEVEVTRELNLPREDFVHEDSCWWTDYFQSRCALKTNGGFGLRTFRGTRYDGSDCPRGRAWVMPLKLNERGRLKPTFETQNPDAFVVFNGYGDLEGYIPARIMAHMAGMTYRKIGFYSNPMYINNDSAYLVAPEEIAAKHTDGSLSLSLQQHSNLFEQETERELTNA